MKIIINKEYSSVYEKAIYSAYLVNGQSRKYLCSDEDIEVVKARATEIFKEYRNDIINPSTVDEIDVNKI